MRRALASLLLTLFTFPVVLPLLRADTARNVPACCRLNGKHHCAMPSTNSDSSIPSLRSKCAYYGSTIAVRFESNVALRNTAQPIYASLLRRSASPALHVTFAREPFSRSRQKRGPPTLIS